MRMEWATPETDGENEDAKHGEQERMQVNDNNTSPRRIFPIMTFSERAAVNNACPVLRVKWFLVGW